MSKKIAIELNKDDWELVRAALPYWSKQAMSTIVSGKWPDGSKVSDEEIIQLSYALKRCHALYAQIGKKL